MGVSFDASSGLNRLCCFVSGKAVNLLPDNFSVRSRVHEYGGGAWCLAGDLACFVNNEDQAIWLKSLETYEDPQLLTQAPQTRFADLQADTLRNRLLAVSETHQEDCAEPINRLVGIDLNSGQVNTLAEGADFYSSPALSPDGRQLAWIEWDHPQQPWRCTRLMQAELGAEGEIIECVQVSDKQEAAWAQPRFSPAGQLHVVVDRQNWWHIERLTPEGLVPLAGDAPANTEFTTAPWQLGLSTYGWNHEGELLALGQSEGYTRLWRHNGHDWEPMELGVMPARLHALACNGQHLACVAEFSDREPAILRIDTELTADDPDQTLVLSGGSAPAFQVSLPLSLSATVQNQQVPYFLYRPAGVPANQPLPLVIWTHGGPTATTAPILKPAIQYWTQRGFMIADVNYRGSTGYGRSYRMQLEQQWGISDVQDVEAVVRSLIKQGLADAKAVFIRGNSAGGYTTLSALCHSSLFQGGASLYGVSDPARLNDLTHKFESRYLHWLIADPDVHPERYQQRAPLAHAERIQVPVIFFQGEQDKVVPPEQTGAMVERLRAKGLHVETHYFPDEAHGFHLPENQAKVLEAELAFYLQLINLTLS